jgi:hypothetical protein
MNCASRELAKATERREATLTTSLLLVCDKSEFVTNETTPDENKQ